MAATDLAQTNGVTQNGIGPIAQDAPPPVPAAPPAAGPRIPKREVWVDLPDAYPGFRFRAWVNAPKRIVEMLSPEHGETGVRSMLKQCITQHNGWVDYDGQEYAQPTEDAFWDEIPTELATLVIALYQEEVFKLPNSVIARGRR